MRLRRIMKKKLERLTIREYRDIREFLRRLNKYRK